MLELGPSWHEKNEVPVCTVKASQWTSREGKGRGRSGEVITLPKKNPKRACKKGKLKLPCGWGEKKKEERGGVDFGRAENLRLPFQKEGFLLRTYGKKRKVWCRRLPEGGKEEG